MDSNVLACVPIAPVTTALIHLSAEVHYGKAVLVERRAMGCVGASTSASGWQATGG